MICSLIWIYMFKAGRIGEELRPWLIYIPAVIVELVSYSRILPKFCNWLEKRERNDKNHD